ncbi:MAG: hypothetical protein AAB966_00415, partial [Patescibacteria group bacterium]
RKDAELNPKEKIDSEKPESGKPITNPNDEGTRVDVKDAADIGVQHPELTRDMLELIRNGGDLGKALEKKGNLILNAAEGDGQQIALGLDITLEGLKLRKQTIMSEKKQTQESHAKLQQLNQEIEKLQAVRNSNKVKISEKEIELPVENQVEDFVGFLYKAAGPDFTSQFDNLRPYYRENNIPFMSAAQSLWEKAIKSKDFRRKWVDGLQEAGLPIGDVVATNEAAKSQHVKDVRQTAVRIPLKVGGAVSLLALLSIYTSMKKESSSGQR